MELQFMPTSGTTPSAQELIVASKYYTNNIAPTPSLPLKKACHLMIIRTEKHLPEGVFLPNL